MFEERGKSQPLGDLGNVNTTAAPIALGRVTCIMHTVNIRFVVSQKIRTHIWPVEEC